MARYDYGVERRIPVEGMTESEIETIVEQLVKEADQVNSYIV
eukprot:CAMPEP_0168330252 /NCGR_PEP_ID=MMETSP0213-20121227/7608_1 /TAXON_ID=151035 /ORGANISM="Euplotes harpa, Strain FSP1.4" /LENGTH=41 /DNA_ID= /DNA_START= /DNA_END= /DNA_ORIENTATION=